MITNKRVFTRKFNEVKKVFNENGYDIKYFNFKSKESRDGIFYFCFIIDKENDKYVITDSADIFNWYLNFKEYQKMIKEFGFNYFKENFIDKMFLYSIDTIAEEAVEEIIDCIKDEKKED